MTSVSAEHHHAMTAMIAVVGAVSLSFNAFTVAVFARNRLLRTVNNWLVANLAVSDLLYVITDLFYVIAACVIALSDFVPRDHISWTAPLCRSLHAPCLRYGVQ